MSLHTFDSLVALHVAMEDADRAHRLCYRDPLPRYCSAERENAWHERTHAASVAFREASNKFFASIREAAPTLAGTVEAAGAELKAADTLFKAAMHGQRHLFPEAYAAKSRASVRYHLAREANPYPVLKVA